LSNGKPEIFNTDQGSQFTSEAFTGLLLEHGVQISMDGKGRYLDNIFVERLWRSIKKEEVYLKAYETGSEARRGIDAYEAFRINGKYSTFVDISTADFMQFLYGKHFWIGKNLMTGNHFLNLKKQFAGLDTTN